ncbi:MAG: hypothetical protein AB1705_13610, partial [Verrucomicrobiota bacterium]
HPEFCAPVLKTAAAVLILANTLRVANHLSFKAFPDFRSESARHFEDPIDEGHFKCHKHGKTGNLNNDVPQ